MLTAISCILPMALVSVGRAGDSCGGLLDVFSGEEIYLQVLLTCPEGWTASTSCRKHKKMEQLIMF